MKREKSLSLGSSALKIEQLPTKPNMESQSNMDLVPAWPETHPAEDDSSHKPSFYFEKVLFMNLNSAKNAFYES